MKIMGNGARRGHGVPSRYWSPLGVSEHFVGGWEPLYKAFHGSWYIAVAFTCCFIRVSRSAVFPSSKRTSRVFSPLSRPHLPSYSLVGQTNEFFRSTEKRITFLDLESSFSFPSAPIFGYDTRWGRNSIAREGKERRNKQTRIFDFPENRTR